MISTVSAAASRQPPAQWAQCWKLATSPPFGTSGQLLSSNGRPSHTTYARESGMQSAPELTPLSLDGPGTLLRTVKVDQEPVSMHPELTTIIRFDDMPESDIAMGIAKSMQMIQKHDD